MREPLGTDPLLPAKTPPSLQDICFSEPPVLGVGERSLRSLNWIDRPSLETMAGVSTEHLQITGWLKANTLLQGYPFQNLTLHLHNRHMASIYKGEKNCHPVVNELSHPSPDLCEGALQAKVISEQLWSQMAI